MKEKKLNLAELEEHITKKKKSRKIIIINESQAKRLIDNSIKSKLNEKS
jgi:hypothetical protein